MRDIEKVDRVFLAHPELSLLLPRPWLVLC